MACPCSLYLAKLFLPETSTPETAGSVHAEKAKSPYVNAIDAAASGTSDGLRLALNVAAMRGVAVDILLPGKNNLPFVPWASQAHWWQGLEYGLPLWPPPPPVCHPQPFILDSFSSSVHETEFSLTRTGLPFES